MHRSLIFSAALRHRVQIPYRFRNSSASCPDPFCFRWLSGIVPGSFSFQRFSDIVSESHFLFGGSLALCLNLLLFRRLSTSCSDPLSFQRLSSIMPGSLIFSMTLWHRAQIPYHFDGSPMSCPDFLVLNHCNPAPLAFGIVVLGQNCWPLILQ